MVPDVTPSSAAEASNREVDSSTALNAVIGAVAGIVLSFIPLSTLLGGGIAGYLEGGAPKDGAKVGAIAGLAMLVPFALVGLLFAVFFLGLGGGPPLAFLAIAGIVLVFGALYTVGLSAVGGYLGVYVAREL